MSGNMVGGKTVPHAVVQFLTPFSSAVTGCLPESFQLPLQTLGRDLTFSPTHCPQPSVEVRRYIYVPDTPALGDVLRDSHDLVSQRDKPPIQLFQFRLPDATEQPKRKVWNQSEVGMLFGGSQ